MQLLVISIFGLGKPTRIKSWVPTASHQLGDALMEIGINCIEKEVGRPHFVLGTKEQPPKAVGSLRQHSKLSINCPRTGLSCYGGRVP